MTTARHGRYAPSPSGTLHLGNLRTALLAWLFARSTRGRFVLRFDDLDPDRSRPEHAAAQLRDLEAIGLDWDGEPVYESARLEHYAEALRTLEDDGLVYPCFCTRADIRASTTAPHGDGPPPYPGTCRELTAAQRSEREVAGRPPALRVRTGEPEIAFADRLLGAQSGLVDDFVVRRNDGAFAYQLTVVVDDDFDGVTEVVRGSDLAGSTPRQLWVAGALGVAAPASFAHVPLILGPDGKRLAKRHGAVTLADRVAAGERAEDVATWLLRTAGQDVADGAGREERVAAFDPSRIPREPTVLAPA